MNPVIQLEDVDFSYTTPAGSVAVLKSVTLDIQSGDYLSIVGPSGAGKSTLLNVIGLLDAPTSGSYQVGGRQTETMTELERTRWRGEHIGFVFQSFHLLPGRSALTNVALAGTYSGRNRRARNVAAKAALEQVGLGHRWSFPVQKLSGGERQRVAIARAISTSPQLLLCDEPTGNLDSANTETVLEILDRLHETGNTIVVITHDNNVAQRATHQMSLLDGNLHRTTSDHLSIRLAQTTSGEAI